MLARKMWLARIIVFWIGLVGGPGAWAQTAAEELDAAARDLDTVEQGIKRGTERQRTLERWVKQVNAAKGRANTCLTRTEEALGKLNQDLSKLGEVARGEPIEVTRKRAAVQEEKAGVEKRLATCRLLVLRSDEALTALAALQKQLLARRLTVRGPTFFELLQDNWEQPAIWVTSTKSFLLEQRELKQLSLGERAVLTLLLLAALIGGVLMRRELSAWTETHRWRADFSSRFSRSLTASLARYAPHLLVSLAAALFSFYVTHDTESIPFISVVAYGLPVYFVSVAVIHLLLVPYAPGGALFALPEAIARALAQRLKVLALLVFLGFLLFTTLLAQRLPEPAFLLTRAVFFAVFVLNLMWAVWLLGRLPRFAKTLILRVGVHTLLFSTVVAEWLGYRNLSLAVLRTVLGTLFVLGLALLVGRLLREMFDGLQLGRYLWQRRLRRFMGLKPGDHVPGLGWLRVITFLALWVVFALAVLRVWGLSAAALQEMREYVVEGFTIGSLRILPTRILLAVVSITVLLAVSGWFRAKLERKWLTKTRMDRGAREAMVTMSGYTGIAIAVIVGLAVAGLEFGKLALIAGALSVGIGFGLQNIVNNFISGLILLFERPIKTGDWIVTGTTEGYVKRIRIRATQIQTFDRADVIVPNSELISAQVTNWMLYDPGGRVRVPIGVAYGSDTEKVRQVLLAVAAEHPLVVNDASAPEPTALFLAFGDSSLNFELRCHIRNIDQRLQVISDLNFAIDAAFRRDGIEIPFPQRDLHIRDWPASGRLPPEPTGEDDSAPTE